MATTLIIPWSVGAAALTTAVLVDEHHERTLGEAHPDGSLGGPPPGERQSPMEALGHDFRDGPTATSTTTP